MFCFLIDLENGNFVSNNIFYILLKIIKLSYIIKYFSQNFWLIVLEILVCDWRIQWVFQVHMLLLTLKYFKINTFNKTFLQHQCTKSIYFIAFWNVSHLYASKKWSIIYFEIMKVGRISINFFMMKLIKSCTNLEARRKVW